MTVCGADRYETVAPTATSDRECAEVLAACGDDEYQVAAPTATSDRVCELKTDCLNQDAEDEEIQTHWLKADGENFLCEELRDACGEGFNEIQAPGENQDRICSTCEEGQWEDHSGEAVECKDLSAACDEDTQYQSVEPGQTNDRQCESVVSCVGDGTSAATKWLKADGNAFTCEALDVCELGVTYESAAPSDYANRVCSGVRAACALNEYQSAAPTLVANRVCAPLTVCEPGEKVSLPHTPTANRECEPCALGTYCAGGDAVEVSCFVGDHDNNPATPCASIVSSSLRDHNFCALVLDQYTDTSAVGCGGVSGSDSPTFMGFSFFSDGIVGATDIHIIGAYFALLTTRGAVAFLGGGRNEPLNAFVDALEQPHFSDLEIRERYSCALVSAMNGTVPADYYFCWSQDSSDPEYSGVLIEGASSITLDENGDMGCVLLNETSAEFGSNLLCFEFGAPDLLVIEFGSDKALPNATAFDIGGHARNGLCLLEQETNAVLCGNADEGMVINYGTVDELGDGEFRAEGLYSNGHAAIVLLLNESDGSRSLYSLDQEETIYTFAGADFTVAPDDDHLCVYETGRDPFCVALFGP